jgi:uncharacterized protein YkwD
MRKLVYLFLISVFLIPSICQAGLSYDLKGMILLQVEDNGEAWYIYPDNQQRYYLGRPDDAFNLMKELGLGIKHTELEQYLGSYFPGRLKGKILLDVELNGEAYYVYPKDAKGYYLGRPNDAFNLMREKGLGITNTNLNLITVNSSKQNNNHVLTPVAPLDTNDLSDTIDVDVNIPLNPSATETELVEGNVYNYVNEHRIALGSSKLVWHSEISKIARIHSQNMASGSIEPSHEGFDQRIVEIKLFIFQTNGSAENLAWNYNYGDPAQAAFDWWMTSPGHKASLENNFYDQTGVGAAKSADGKFYITQIFININ